MANQNSTPSTGGVRGFLGNDPRVIETKERSFTYNWFDPILEEMTPRTGTQPAGEFRTFRLAIQDQGMEEAYWLDCVDWENHSKLCRKGDLVRLTGRVEDRTYIDKKTNEEKTVKQFVVETLRIEKTKIRHRAG